MIVSRSTYGRFGAFGAEGDPCQGLDWEAWCDCRFANDPTLRVKCKSKPWSCCPFGICPPWASPTTPVGQACRGLPKEGSGVLTDVAYAVQTGLSFVSLVDRIAVPMQEKSIVAKEAEVAAQKEQEAIAAAAQEAALKVRQAVGKYTQYGVLAAGGVLGVILLKRMFTKKPAARAAAAGSPKLNGVRRRRS